MSDDDMDLCDPELWVDEFLYAKPLHEAARLVAPTGAEARDALMEIAAGLEAEAIPIVAVTPGEAVAIVGAALLAAGTILHVADEAGMTTGDWDPAGPTQAQREAVGRVTRDFTAVLQAACLGWAPEHTEYGWWCADQVGPHDEAPAGGAA